ncbi:hypothetical protein BLL42_17175 [Pseudomonas frederiksbergensis]|uniref:Lipoprotein n=1 Tax=Pseudomonas frederiksbergensis TaxID=104087 RepID=A0A1J0EMM8_9PSED|nr:hypothetical protein [Pseudomonas frederiksbergensis]APC17386.1 hypothetical protein BLL42_17175 [Pseudomonas frederiksbergensis]
MKILINTILLTAFTLISACGQTETSPIEVSLGEHIGFPAIYLEAVTDKVRIEGFEINRGNCNHSSPQIPADLIFGGRLEILAFGCNVKELSVNTNHGNFTYSF